MLETLVFFLALIDLFLLWLAFRSNKAVDTRIETLESIAEERKIIQEMLDQLRIESKRSQAEMSGTLESVKIVAAEFEQELKGYQNSIAEDIGKIEAEIRHMVEAPIDAIAQKQIQLKKLFSKIDKQKEVIVKVINKGEKICQFLDDRIPFEELLSEINDKKYSDARALLASGRSPKEVALDLGLSESEVRLVAGLSI